MVTTQHDPPRTRRRHPQQEQLLARLEASYEFHTEQLTRRVAVRGPQRTIAPDPATAASRRALTSIAAALRDMAEGRYGLCEACGEPIADERLRARPETRRCARCQGAPAS
jgi:RNA polymerase-binding transcription factor DksA